MPILSAVSVFSIWTGLPWKVMVPLSAMYMPMSTFIKVDFPAPFSPISACTVPLRTVSPTSLSAFTPGNDLEMFSITRMVS